VLIGLGAAALLVAGAVLGAWFARQRDARRLERIRAAATRLAEGDWQVRVPIDSHDLWAATGRALNDLADRTVERAEDWHAEHAMRDAVLESLSDGVALLTTELVIRHANERFWELVGVDRPPEPRPHLAITRQPVLEEVVEEAIHRGRAVVREVPLYVRERTEYEVSATPVREGDREGWLLTIESLRPEREMASLRREFVANASHELKTPLTSIRGYAETLLAGGLEDAENRARFVETINAQAIRLEALVEDLLQLADLDRPDAALDLKDWDFSSVVREVCGGFEDLARRSGLAFEMEIPSGLHVLCDRKRIELALGNLLDNAVKYTERGSIAVRVERTPTVVRVSVADTGRGIPEEHMPRVFERFYRVDRSRARAFGGTGLGLAIVKHAIQLHAGHVGVESKSDEGSTFWFEIPRGGPGPGAAGGGPAPSP
jgi:two-component system phosphate regulon sensor histidine kinase PhoR